MLLIKTLSLSNVLRLSSSRTSPITLLFGSLFLHSLTMFLGALRCTRIQLSSFYKYRQNISIYWLIWFLTKKIAELILVAKCCKNLNFILILLIFAQSSGRIKIHSIRYLNINHKSLIFRCLEVASIEIKLMLYVQSTEKLKIWNFPKQKFLQEHIGIRFLFEWIV